MKSKIILFATLLLAGVNAKSFAQNVGVNTDGSTPETGVMLDVKGTNPFSTTGTQNVFQIKSFDASGNELKMRMILGTNSTAASSYAGMEVYDVPNAAYRALVFQPSGGNVGIGTTAPRAILEVTGVSTYPTIAFGQGTIAAPSTTSAYGSIVGKSANSNFTLNLQDGSRTALLWNATGTSGNYIVTGEPAVRQRFHVSTGGVVEFAGAPAGTAGNAISWTTMGSMESGNYVWLSPRGTSSDFYIPNASGYVGMGTTSPTSRLELSDATQLVARLKLSGQEFFQAANTSTDGVAFLLGVNRANNRQLWIAESDKLTQNATNVAVRIMPSTTIYNAGLIDVISTDATTLKNLSLNPFGGNVGIGITAPLDKLHVVGNTRISTLAGVGTRMVQADVNGVLTPLAAGTASQVLLGNGTWGSIPGASGNYIQNQIASAQATSNYWISGTGRANQLVIDGASLAAGNLQFSAANPYITASSYFICPGGAYFNSGTVYTEAQYQCRGGIHNDAAAYLTIAGGTSSFTSFSGAVGINGVTSSTYMLEVNGKIKSTSINESSDIRWKKDISTLENALTKVQQLRGVNYNWRTDEFKDKAFDTTPQIGLIAQEVEKVYPQVVCTDKDGFKSVEYSKLVAVLIEALKEQQKQFEAQQNKVDELQKTVAELLKASSIGTTAKKDK